MKVIVTHYSPDLDGIASIWLIRKFLPGWEKAKIRFVPAGEKLGERGKGKGERDEIIHVDTGLGVLDHHQIPDENVSAASLTWDFIKNESLEFRVQSSERVKDKMAAIERIIRVVTEIDHFKEALWAEPLADYHEFSLLGIFEGLRKEFPQKEKFQIDFLIKCFEALLHRFEDRIWAEKELKKGIKFKIRKGLVPRSFSGAGIGFETINDAVLPLAQKAGYILVLRKDPRKGYVRIKAQPPHPGEKGIDLTPAYEKLKKLDPAATWFLHISKKMLLNGTSKNPRMKVTRLGLNDIIKVLKNL